MALLYLALYAALKKASESFMAIAMTLGLVGLAAYFSSNPAFEMLSLSNQYWGATTDAQRSVALAAGQAMLATFTGSAFNVYYVFGAAALLIISIVMLRSRIFGRATAYVRILASIFMMIPSSAGKIGLFFAFISLLPTFPLLIMVGRRMFQLASSSGSR